MHKLLKVRDECTIKYTIVEKQPKSRKSCQNFQQIN